MDVEIEILRFDSGTARVCKDRVAIEAPLEIQVNGENLSVTMRTPGDDFALATGFLFAENVIRFPEDVETLGYGCIKDLPDERNSMQVQLRARSFSDFEKLRLQRNFFSSSSCGVCGKASVLATQCLAQPLPEDSLCVSASIFQRLGVQMRDAQATFDRTGGLHAAALFTLDGEMIKLREDVGRHNAVDKLVGWAFLERRIPLRSHILMVSGRTSFEIMQKAAMAQIPIVCGVSAPSSLAISLAREMNITLIGFLRGGTMNVYSGAGRIGST